MKQHMRVMFAAVPVALVAGWLALGSVKPEAPVEQPKGAPREPVADHQEAPRAAAKEKAPPIEPGETGEAVENPGGVPTTFAEGDAVVVPVGEGDEVPSPERDDGPVVENDPIEPELPQTPEWKLEKTVHVASLVDRQIGRLESELAAAESRGDRAEAQRLKVRLARQKQRLDGIHGEAEALRAEVGGDVVP